METPNEISRRHRCEWKQNLAHQHFCYKTIPVQWCQRHRLAVEGGHNTSVRVQSGLSTLPPPTSVKSVYDFEILTPA